jgi:quinol monooxygenase YgiN
MTVRFIVEMKAKPGQRDELRRLLDKLLTEVGPGLKERGWLGSTLHEALDDPEVLVEIADWESAEGHQAVMGDPATADALGPVLDLLASPFKDRAVDVR